MKTYSGGLDEYALTHLAAQIYSPGAAHYPQLFKLIQCRKWFQAQSEFDPARRHYADSLSIGLRALSERPLSDGRDLPAILVVVALLRATVASLASSLPPGALEALSRLGEHGAAGAYAGLLENELERVISLCRLAGLAQQEGDPQRGRELLAQANQGILAIQRPRSRARALVSLSEAAARLGQVEMEGRSARQLAEIVERGDWPACALARELELLEQPDYLLALMEWDSREGLPSYGFSDIEKYSGLPALVKPVLKRSDRALLASLIEKSGYSTTLYNLLEALVENGAVQEAFQLIDDRGQRSGETLSMQEAAARGAGRRGDIATILRAARYRPPERQAGQPAPERYDTWRDRLEEGVERGIKSAGGRLVGEHPDVLTVYWEGLSSLQEAHPEKVPALVQQLEEDLTRLGRFLSHEAKAYAGQLGIEGGAGRRPRSSRLVGGLMSATVWLAKKGLGDALELSLSEALNTQATWKAMQGDLEGATHLLDEITDPSQRDQAAGMLVEASVMRKQHQRALELAGRIQSASERKSALEAISQGLLKLPPVQAEPLLKRVIGMASSLPQEMGLGGSGLLAALSEALAKTGLVEQAFSLLPPAGQPGRLEGMAGLGRWAASSQKRRLAERALQELEKLPTHAQRPSEAETWMYEESSGLTAPLRHLAELSRALARARGAADPAEAPTWQGLARRAYNLAEAHPLAQIPHTWAWLAKAAADLREREALQRLDKRLAKSPAYAFAEQARVYLAAGFAHLGDYVEPQRNAYPPYPEIVRRMTQKHNQALALAEISLVLRQTAPQKRGMFKTLTRQDLDIYADSLLEHSLRELQISERYTSLGGSLPWLKSSPLKLGTSSLSERRSQLPSLNVMGPYLAQVLRLIEIYCLTGRFKAAEMLAGDVSQADDQAQASAHLVGCLISARQVEQARSIMLKLKSDYARWLGWLVIAESHTANQAEMALEELVTYLLPSLWVEQKYTKALPRLAGLAAALPSDLRLRATQSLLIEAARRDRKSAMEMLAALLPGLSELLEREMLLTMISKIIETESWW